jgi:hypothetical protein
VRYSNSDEDELASDEGYDQLAFPFKVERIQPPPMPNRYSLAPPDDGSLEGGGFIYEHCPAVFLGRTGYGPLRMAWDTNILIDYAEFGDLMWEEDVEFDPPIAEPRYRRELIALDKIIQLWMMRDIRVRAPQRQIYDAQREMDEAQTELRVRQLDQFLAALTCIQLDKEVLENVTPFDTLPDESTSDEWDESLVLEAAATGCHVFLTCDRRLRRRLEQIARELFVVIMSPSDFTQALAGAGQLGWGYAGDMLPDNHKWVHFARATKQSDGD